MLTIENNQLLHMCPLLILIFRILALSIFFKILLYFAF